MFPTMKTIGGAESKKAAKPAAEKAPEAVKEAIDFSKVQIEPLFEEAVDFETFSKSDFRAVKVKACEAVKKSNDAPVRRRMGYLRTASGIPDRMCGNHHRKSGNESSGQRNRGGI